MKRYLLLALIAMAVLIPAEGQVVNCSSGFAAAGACGVGASFPVSGANFTFFGNGGAALSGSAIDLQPTGVVHNPSSVIYQTAVGTQAFTTTFSFTPNAWNLAFVLENVTHNGGAGPPGGYTLAQSFTSGAGCEGGFYQAFGGSSNPPPDNIFALNFDSANLLVNSLTPFYSNVQIYQQVQSPCIPDDGQAWFYFTNKVSTSPVAMNSPATTYQTTTGDTYSATIIYTGINLILNMYDVSTGGTCSPPTSSTCFSYTWQGVNIPSLVGGTTAYLGFTGSTNAASPRPLKLNSLTYTALSRAAPPTISPSSGTYGGTQSVAISDASSGSVVCYNTTGAPATNGQAGCTNGTLYSGAISVPSGETIYAVAGGSGYADSGIAIAAYKIGSTAAQPTFYPAQGTYQGHQAVLLSAAQGSVICYNTTGSPATDGATGCTTGTLYTGPITVSSNETIYAVAGGTGFAGDSVAGSAAYIISPFAVVDGFTGSYPANSPTYSPIPGTYPGTQSVTLSTTTPGAYICYIASSTPPTLLPETNNLGACSVGARYSSPIAVASTETIYAIASTTIGANVAGTGPPSSLVQGSYTIGSSGGTTASTPTFSPVAGTYTGMQLVTISDATSGATIYYTSDGTTPGTSSTQYTGPIAVSSTETLQAIAVVTGDINSAVASATYTINPSQTAAATPTFSVAAGTYSSAQSVTISDATSGATIYYTTNGAAPSTSSSQYSGPITVSSTETLQAIAAAAGDTNSAVASATYTINPALPSAATPTFSPAAGTYSSAQSVTVSDATSGATIYYTTNGSAPGTSSTAYTGPITVSSTETLQAIAVATGDSNSAVASATYTINPALPSAATPTFSLPAGTYSSAQSVTVSDTTSGATIYYTTNGSAPGTSSTAYTGPITVSSTETLQAIAVATGYSNSAVASATYTISSSAPNFVLGTSLTSLTVDSGGKGTLTLTVTPVNGFQSPVILACSGLPAGATCSFESATVTPSGGAATTQLTISAGAPSSAVRPGSRPFLPLTTLAMTVCLFGWRKRQGLRHWLLLAVAFAGLGLVFGCAKTGTAIKSSTTSLVTVTGISGTLQGKATIMLTVN